MRHVKRLLYALKKHGDKAVVHGLRGKPSNRKIEEKIEQEAMQILSEPKYRGFGPTLAAEQLSKKQHIEASRETVRQWMMRAKLWRGKKAKVAQVHEWRPRRSRFGELVQCDTSDQVVPDRQDRRRDQPAVCALRAAGFQRGEYPVAVEIAGKV